LRICRGGAPRVGHLEDPSPYRPVSERDPSAGTFDGPKFWHELEPEADKRKEAHLNRFAVTDDDGEPAANVQPGDRLRLYSEFLVARDWGSLSPGFVVANPRGLVTIAKHLFQIADVLPAAGERPSYLQASFEFECQLAPGEYTVEFVLIGFNMELAKFLQLPREDLAKTFTLLEESGPVASFRVIPAEGTIAGIRHFGLVDIPVHSQVRMTNKN